MGRPRTVSEFVDTDADETDCAECDATIEIDAEESVTDAILRHFRAAGHIGA